MNAINNFKNFSDTQKLGHGGTAEVYRVRNSKGLAALKIPLDNSSDKLCQFRRLINQEFNLINIFKYPGIVNILEKDDSAEPYLMLEYCAGPTLEKVGKIDSLQLAINIFSSIAVNLEFIHAHRIIHADIKPDNIFLPSNYKSLKPEELFYTKLSDFSLGCYMEECDSERAGLGTLGYMAPETLSEKRVSVQSDLFALGVTAYQLISGVHPFISENSDPVKINSRVKEEEPKPLSEFRDDIPEQLQTLVNLLLAKDESNRPNSAWDVCCHLEQIGATFPFRKALNIKYFVNPNSDIDDNLIHLQIKDRELNQLYEFTDKNFSNLRLVLSHNNNRDNIVYENGKFSFKSNILLPHVILSKALNYFDNTSFRNKKKLVEQSICGSYTEWQSCTKESDEYLSSASPLLNKILTQLLRPLTIKRISKRFSEIAKAEGNLVLASKLFVNTGDILSAEEMAYQASNALNKENRHEESISLLNLVIDSAKIKNQLSDVKMLIKLMGVTLKQTGKTDKAKDVLFEITKLYENNEPDELLAETYTELGDIYKIEQKSKEGIEVLDKALEIYKQVHNELEISRTYNKIGNIYWVGSELTKALSFYRKAFRMQKKMGATEALASTVNNMGVLNAIQNRFDRAVNLLEISLKLNKEVGNQLEMARTLNNMGFMCYQTNKKNKAIEYLKEAFEINKKINNQNELLYNLDNFTSILIEAGKLSDSVKYLKEGIALSDEIKDQPHQATFNLRLGQVLTYTGRIKDAREWFEKAKSIIDSVDYKILEGFHDLQRANMLFQLGDIKNATNLVENCINIGKDLKDNRIMLDSNLLNCRLNPSQEKADYLKTLAEEQQNLRVKALVDYIMIDHFLNTDKLESANSIYKNLTEYNQFNEDIEYSFVLTTTAKLKHYNNENETAKEFAKKAVDNSKNLDLKFELIDSLTLLGKINNANGDYEDCYDNYREALGVAKFIISNLSNIDEQKIFSKKPVIKKLSEEIKNLSTILSA